MLGYADRGSETGDRTPSLVFGQQVLTTLHSPIFSEVIVSSRDAQAISRGRNEILRFAQNDKKDSPVIARWK